MKYTEEDIRTVSREEFPEERGNLEEKEGLACRGAAEPEGYANGLTHDLKEAEIVDEGAEPSDVFSEVIHREVNDERNDVILPFAENAPIDIGKMSLWRLQTPFKWISDYLDQEPELSLNDN